MVYDETIYFYFEAQTLPWILFYVVFIWQRFSETVCKILIAQCKYLLKQACGDGVPFSYGHMVIALLQNVVKYVELQVQLLVSLS